MTSTDDGPTTNQPFLDHLQGRLLVMTVCCVVVVGGVGRAQENDDRFVTLRGMAIDTLLRPVPLRPRCCGH